MLREGLSIEHEGAQPSLLSCSSVGSSSPHSMLTPAVASHAHFSVCHRLLRFGFLIRAPHDAGASDELDEVEGELMKKQEDTPVDEVIVSHQLVVVRL